MQYIKMALRHLLKRPLFSGLNLLGLTISMAGALLIGQYVYSELKTDEFIADQDRTFRLLRTSDINNEPYDVGVTSAPFKDALLTDFPHEIAEATRVRFFNEPINSSITETCNKCSEDQFLTLEKGGTSLVYWSN